MAEQIYPLNDIEAKTIEAQNINIANETISVLSAQYIGTNAAGAIQEGTLTPLFNSVTSAGIITAANGTAGTDVINYSQFSNIGIFSEQQLPNGYKIQAGQTTVAATSGTITFNTPFTNAPLVVLCAQGGIATEVATNVVTISNFTYTSSVAANVSFIAIGI